MSGDAPLGTADSLICGLPEGVNLITDVMDVLGRNESARCQKFLNDLRTRMTSTRGLTVLRGLKGESVLDNRDLTEHMTGMIFGLGMEINGPEIVNRLAIPKFRGGRALDETTKLRLAERVSVDTDRDIT